MEVDTPTPSTPPDQSPSDAEPYNTAQEDTIMSDQSELKKRKDAPDTNTPDKLPSTPTRSQSSTKKPNRNTVQQTLGECFSNANKEPKADKSL